MLKLEKHFFSMIIFMKNYFSLFCKGWSKPISLKMSNTVCKEKTKRKLLVISDSHNDVAYIKSHKTVTCKIYITFKRVSEPHSP